MRFEIPFDEKIFRQQLKLNFDLTWKDNLIRNRNSLFYGIGFIILGFLCLFFRENIGFVLLGTALFYVMNFYNYYSYYKKRKKIYFNSVNDLVLDYQKYGINNIWEFGDDEFRFKDYRFETKIKWKAFKGFILRDDNLFIYLDDDKMLAYILGKSEVGKENFNKIIDLLNLKIKGQVPIFNRARD